MHQKRFAQKALEICKDVDLIRWVPESLGPFCGAPNESPDKNRHEINDGHDQQQFNRESKIPAQYRDERGYKRERNAQRANDESFQFTFFVSNVEAKTQ
jgi:uncharacterized protein YecA (UPF0149 family)